MACVNFSMVKKLIIGVLFVLLHIKYAVETHLLMAMREHVFIPAPLSKGEIDRIQG